MTTLLRLLLRDSVIRNPIVNDTLAQSPNLGYEMQS